MAKLTATEFKNLKDDAARYSAYDDAASAEEEARRAQSDALADHQAALDEAAQVKADNDAAIKKLNNDHTTALQEATEKAAGELAAAKVASDQALADTQAKAVADLAAKDAELMTLKAANADLTATIQKVFPTVQAGLDELAKVRKAELIAKAAALDAEAAKAREEADKMDAPIVAEVDRNTVDRTNLRG